MVSTKDLVDQMMDYEAGELNDKEKCAYCNQVAGIHKMSCPTQKATVFINDTVKAYYDQMEKEVHQNRSNLNK
jgi:hypothetical protein